MKIMYDAKFSTLYDYNDDDPRNVLVAEKKFDSIREIMNFMRYYLNINLAEYNFSLGFDENFETGFPIEVDDSNGDDVNLLLSIAPVIVDDDYDSNNYYCNYEFSEIKLIWWR